MFYSITGKLVLKDEIMAVVEANGVAYEALISRSAYQHLPEIGTTATLFTRLIVREDDMFLVGFLSYDERRLFDTLLTVSGIGPKQGLKILSEMSPGDIRNAIITGNESLLSKVKGVGPKTASRIILELKDKIRKLQISDIPAHTSSTEKKKFETLLAMRVLGFSDIESRRAIDAAFTSPESIQNKEVEEIIKIVLSRMGR